MFSFESVEVYPNPSRIFPELVIHFDSNHAAISSLTIAAGDKLQFSLYLKYAVRVTSFSWSLPEDSLFCELERSSILDGKTYSSAFSPDEVFLAQFEWVPLTAGVFPLPQVLVAAETYTGNITEPEYPRIVCTVSETAAPADDTHDSETGLDIFAQAFSESSIEDSSNTRDPDKVAAAIHIAQLRSGERNRMIFIQLRAQRQEAERVAGMENDANEPSVMVFCFFCTALLILLGFLAFFLIRKKKHVLPIVSLCVIVLFLCLYSGIPLFPVYGIYVGGDIKMIPETDATTVMPLAAGTRVHVSSEAGGWMYIEFDGNKSGWVPSASVAVIR
jgi:hypothetical protein